MEQSLRERIAKLKYDLVEYRWKYFFHDSGYEAEQNYTEEQSKEYEESLKKDGGQCQYQKDWCYGSVTHYVDYIGGTCVESKDSFIWWNIVPDFENDIGACWELIEELNKKYGVKNIPIYESEAETCEGICREYLWYKE